MAEKLAELPLVLPRTAAELTRAVELMSRKINEIIRTSRVYLDDVTELDSIPGNLDAAKIYGALSVDSVEASSAILGDTTITGFFEIPAGTSVNGFVWTGATGAPFSGLPSGSALNANFNADYLDSEHGAFYLDRQNHTGTQDWSTISGLPSTLVGYGIGDAASDAELASHENDTTNIHGIADTSQIAFKNTSSTYTTSQIFQRTASNLLAVRFSTPAGAFTEIMVDGSYAMGAGGSPRDVRFLRSGAGVLQVDNASGGAGKLHVTGELELDGALNHDGTTVGFYGVAPVTRPALTYSRTGETTAEAQIRTALASLGLVLDSTVP